MKTESQLLSEEITKKSNKLRKLENPEKTKEQNKKYNDKMHLTRKGQINKIKQSLAKLQNFKNRCFVCHAKLHKKGMTFHHKFYVTGDIVRSNYPKNEKGTLDYYTALEQVIRKYPSRFLYVCNPHHQSITRLSRFNSDNMNRLVRAVRMTK